LKVGGKQNLDFLNPSYIGQVELAYLFYFVTEAVPQPDEGREPRAFTGWPNSRLPFPHKKTGRGIG
jgi:hypothetical protein